MNRGSISIRKPRYYGTYFQVNILRKKDCQIFTEKNQLYKFYL